MAHALMRQDTGDDGVAIAPTARRRRCVREAVRRPEAGTGRLDTAYEIVRDFAGLDALEADWNALYAHVAGTAPAFQQFYRLSAWAKSYARDRSTYELAIVVARVDDAVVAIAPLAVRRTCGLRTLTWMGDPVAQYGEVLVDARHDTDRLCKEALAQAIAATRPDVVHLRRVRADGAVFPVLMREGYAVVARDAAPYLDLATASTADTYQCRYATKARRNRRRLFRRLEANRHVTFERRLPGKEAGRAALAALSMKRGWLTSRAETSKVLLDRRTAEWLSAIASDPRTQCRITEMRCDGEIAAAQIGFCDGDRLSLFLIVFSLNYEKEGVGTLHLDETIRECFDEGITTIDMLGPCSAYKLKWADALMETVDFAHPLTAKGWLFTRLYLGLGRDFAKRLFHALPPVIRKACCLLPGCR